LKEPEADVLALSAGIKSRSEIISSNGRDPEQGFLNPGLARDPPPPRPAVRRREQPLPGLRLVAPGVTIRTRG
jgi:hypothetical protein